MVLGIALALLRERVDRLRHTEDVSAAFDAPSSGHDPAQPGPRASRPVPGPAAEGGRAVLHAPKQSAHRRQGGARGRTTSKLASQRSPSRSRAQAATRSRATAERRATDSGDGVGAPRPPEVAADQRALDLATFAADRAAAPQPARRRVPPTAGDRQLLRRRRRAHAGQHRQPPAPERAQFCHPPGDRPDQQASRTLRPRRGRTTKIDPSTRLRSSPRWRPPTRSCVGRS